MRRPDASHTYTHIVQYERQQLTLVVTTGQQLLSVRKEHNINLLIEIGEQSHQRRSDLVYRMITYEICNKYYPLTSNTMLINIIISVSRNGPR